MKTKVSIFLGFVAAVTGSLLFFTAAPAHAEGETYTWMNATTLRGSGGFYTHTDYPKGNNVHEYLDYLDFKQVGDTYQASKTSSGCTYKLTITVAANYITGKITESRSGVRCASSNVTKNFTIDHPENRQVDYPHADCNNNSQNRGDKAKCAAIKACVNEAKKALGDCETAYDTCITNHLDDDNKISNEAKKACAEAVTKGDLDAAKKDPDGPSNDKSTCVITGIGWLVCPVMTFMSKLVDASYKFVSSLLFVQPLFTSGQTQGTYQAWSIMRNIANVAFVIAFLVIILSQVTSFGISNYGIKKLLPRLVIAAILVNVSYWVCAIAVDASNILGKSFMDVFNGLEGSLAIPNSGDFGAEGTGWEGITGTVLAGTGAVAAIAYVGLAALLPILIAVLLAIVTVFLTLILRQALIILLIVISPLAFVAYLLPNTESCFKKWRGLLQTLLLMYPIISIIFGGSAFASKIVIASATGPYTTIVKLAGAGIAIIPLFITPIVMKTAGGLLNRIAGVVNNPNKGMFDRMRKGAEGYRDNRQEFRRLKGMNGQRVMPGVATFNKRKASREAVLNNRKAELNRATADYVASTVEGNDVSASQQVLGKLSRGRLGGQGLRDQMAQGGGDGADMRARAQAVSQQQKLEAENVTAAKAVIEHLNIPFDQLKAIAQGGSAGGLDGADAATRRAAVQMAIGKSTVSDAEDIIKSSGGMNAAQRQDLAEGIVKSGLTNKALHLGGKTLDDIAQGKVTSDADLDNAVAYHFNKGKYSAEALVSQDGKSIERVVKVGSAGVAPDGTAIDVTQKATVAANADKAVKDNRLNSRISSKEASAGINTMSTW